MNELLQKHGCSNVFSYPDGLRELMADISREVLREQPKRLYEFITNYLAVLLLTREHGYLSVKIIEDLCDCRPSVSEHLMSLGLEKKEAKAVSKIIKSEIESVNYADSTSTLKEVELVKKVLKSVALDEEKTAKVCEIAQNAYKDYWYRKSIMEQSLKDLPGTAWEAAAQRTLNIYRTTRPTMTELTQAASRIQAAYRGYYIRKRMLKHLRPKKKQGPKIEMEGTPEDAGGSREADFGPLKELEVNLDNVDKLFIDEEKKQAYQYNPFYATIGEPDDKQRKQSRMMSSKHMTMPFYGSKKQHTDNVTVAYVGGTSKTSSDASSLIPDIYGKRKISFGPRSIFAPKPIDHSDEELTLTIKPQTQELTSALKNKIQDPIKEERKIADNDLDIDVISSLMSSVVHSAIISEVDNLSDVADFEKKTN